MASFFPLGKNGALANQLKKAEVKVSSQEDRKSGETEMRQRTSRYCMNTKFTRRRLIKKNPREVVNLYLVKAAAQSGLFQLDPVLLNTERVGGEPAGFDAGPCWEMPLQRWH